LNIEKNQLYFPINIIVISSLQKFKK